MKNITFALILFSLGISHVAGQVDECYGNSQCEDDRYYNYMADQEQEKMYGGPDQAMIDKYEDESQQNEVIRVGIICIFLVIFVGFGIMAWKEKNKKK